MDNKSFVINKNIKSAINSNKPIVALESSLISHGFPYPENIKVAKLSIDAVKKTGSIPATIGIINGKIKVGLNNKDLELLASNSNIEKVSVHNLSLALSNNQNAATTVASTVFIASKLGIKFFATGGIGGVHLDFNKTFDVSSDLNQLSKSKMFIICSGAKSILDLDKTYEKLETLGIPRIGFNTDLIPGFWYRETNKKVDYNYKNIKKLSNYLHNHEKLNQNISVLIFNPLSKEKALSKTKINLWIKKSMISAKYNKIYGKNLTPYLIKKINTYSNNKSLEANKELIINNAKLAGKLAFMYKN